MLVFKVIPESPPAPVNPCVPSPCGPFSQCRNMGGYPSCSCLETYVGLPPNCRPECVINADCPSDKACINEKCRDPCPGSCGLNTRCSVYNHIPTCTCEEGYVGDPFVNCHLKPAEGEYVLKFLSFMISNEERKKNKICLCPNERFIFRFFFYNLSINLITILSLEIGSKE